MLNDPVLLLVLLGLALLLAFCTWSAWRGRRVDFVHQIDPGAQSDAVAAYVFDQVIPVLVRDGYQMVAEGGNTTVFEHRYLPAWTVLLAIFLFPFGLVALLARTRETVIVVAGDRTLAMHGCCSRVNADFIIAVADHAAAQVAFAG